MEAEIIILIYPITKEKLFATAKIVNVLKCIASVSQNFNSAALIDVHV